MSADKRKHNQKKSSDKPSPENQNEEKFDEDSLTPWQKENLHYLEEKGSEPPWKLALVGEKQKAKEDTDENEEVAEGKPEKKKKKFEKSKLANKPDNAESEENESKMVQKHTSFANRLPHLKSQRDKVLHKRMIILLTLFFIPLLFFIYYVSPVSKLQEVAVSGNSAVSSEAIVHYSNLTEGSGIWEQFFTRGSAEKAITKKIPQIKSAKISLTGFTSLKVSISEYKELAFLLKDSHYYPILENGMVLNEATANVESDYPIFENFTDQTIIKKTIKAYNQLPDDVANLIDLIQYTPSKSNNHLLTLSMSDGNQVLVPYSTMDSQMKYYSQVASQMGEKGVIDMEVGIFSYPFENDTKDSDENSSENSAENIE